MSEALSVCRTSPIIRRITTRRQREIAIRIRRGNHHDEKEAKIQATVQTLGKHNLR